jgi:hypothetical protein
VPGAAPCRSPIARLLSASIRGLRRVGIYDPNPHQEDVLTAEQQRMDLIARFPKEGWPEMTLDRYAHVEEPPERVLDQTAAGMQQRYLQAAPHHRRAPHPRWGRLGEVSDGDHAGGRNRGSWRRWG